MDSETSKEREYLKRLFEARRDAGAEDEELETIANIATSLDRPPAVPTLSETEEQELFPEPARLPAVTPQEVLAWAQMRAAELIESHAEQANPADDTWSIDAANVMRDELAERFAEDYASWSRDDLLQLVLQWDKGGCKGWVAYTPEELAATIAEMATEDGLMLEQWLDSQANTLEDEETEEP